MTSKYKEYYIKTFNEYGQIETFEFNSLIEALSFIENYLDEANIFSTNFDY